MRLVHFNMFGPDGEMQDVPVNPEQVCFILPILIPNPQNVVGLDGKPMATEAAGLAFGGKILPMSCTVDEAEKKLLGEE